MVQTGFLARRDEQRDAGHRASVATRSRKPVWATEGRLFRPPDYVVYRLRSARPRRVTRLARRPEKTVKAALDTLNGL